MRLIPAAKALLVFGLALHLRHHFHGPAFDYVGLAIAAAASWIGVPGPGEPVLIAAGVFAARHKLDIGSVIFVAWVAATVGGIAGWLIGWGAGRAVLTAPGPLQRIRVKTVVRGDEIFERVPVVAVLLAPSWIAGINRARPRVFLPVNAASALLWAGGIGLGAYYIGPPVIDVVNDVGWVMVVAIVVVVVGVGLLERERRRRRDARQTPASAAVNAEPE